MPTIIVVPKDSVDCNQLTSLVHSQRLTPLHSADVPFRVWQPAVFWTHCWNRTDEPIHYVSKENPELAQNFLEWFGGQQCSVNELAKELAIL